MKKLLNALAYSCVLALLSLFSVSLFWRLPFLLTFILILVAAVMLLIWRDKEDLYLYIFVSLGGAVAEAFAIAFGVWRYAFPNLVGIPLWLPFLWGIAGVFIKRISLEIHAFLKEK